MIERIQITRPCLAIVPNCTYRLTDKAAIALAPTFTGLKLLVRPLGLGELTPVNIAWCRHVELRKGGSA